MKKSIYILVFLLNVAGAFAGNDLLQKAEKAYDSKKYKEAIECYESLVKEGYKSYQLYFNLGNSYYRNDNIGKAIYYYELAKKIEPNDEDIQINLSKATAKIKDDISSKENFFISAVKSNVLTAFSTTTWAWFTIIALITMAVLFFIFVNSTILGIKRISFVLSILFLLTFCITYILGYSATKAKYDNKFAIVLAREVRMMNEPTASGTSKISLHEGTKIRIVESNGDWVLIKLDNGNEGWLKLEDVGII